MKSRIREIRKGKGLTLSDLADRIRPEKTTAQTIGRLETGARKMTLDWLEKIAIALEVHPAELLDFEGEEDIPVAGMLGPSGQIAPPGVESLHLTPPADKPVALKIAHAFGEFKVGDTLLCESQSADDFSKCFGKECLVETNDGARLFGRLIKGATPDSYTVIPPGGDGNVLYDVQLKSAARPVMLLRYY